VDVAFHPYSAFNRGKKPVFSLRARKDTANDPALLVCELIENINQGIGNTYHQE
jgi:hypothetical protein